MNRIDKKFRELRQRQKKAFIAFITAGYPDCSVTKGLILELSRVGVDIIELGVPFSDPLADGEVIQESSQKALSNGINLDRIFDLVSQARLETEIPICLMTYYNPVFSYGEKKFIKQAVKSGVDGLIIPDLPPEEAEAGLKKYADKAGIDVIFFLSPTSSLERLKLVSRISRGFIYYISLTGVTGARNTLPADLKKNIRALKKYVSKPLCVGFGVSSPKQVADIQAVADGVIVGSAIIKKIKGNMDKPADIIKKVGSFVASLKGNSRV